MHDGKIVLEDDVARQGSRAGAGRRLFFEVRLNDRYYEAVEAVSQALSLFLSCQVALDVSGVRGPLCCSDGSCCGGGAKDHPPVRRVSGRIDLAPGGCGRAMPRNASGCGARAPDDSRSL